MYVEAKIQRIDNRMCGSRSAILVVKMEMRLRTEEGRDMGVRDYHFLKSMLKSTDLLFSHVSAAAQLFH